MKLQHLKWQLYSLVTELFIVPSLFFKINVLGHWGEDNGHIYLFFTENNRF